MSKKKRKFICLLVLVLLISLLPPFQSSSSAHISVIEDGIPISSTTKYKIGEFPGGYDYYYTKRWQVQVDGVMQGYMMLMQPKGENSNLGRTFAHQQVLRDWAVAFNGNPDYVQNAVRKTNISRSSDKRTFQRYYSRYIAEESGASIEVMGENSDTAYLKVTTTPKPTVSISAPTNNGQVTSNKAFNVTFSAREFEPFKANFIDYTITVDGSPKASGRISGSSGTKTESIFITGTGKKNIVVTVKDAIWRSSSSQVSVNVNPATPTGKPYLEISPPLKQVKVGELANYTATYYDAAGKATNVTTNAGTSWSSVDSTIGQAQTSKGSFMGLRIGDTTVKATYNGLSATAQLVVAEDPVPPLPEPANEPPTVTIIGPSEVMVGEDFCLSADAHDSDGTIEDYNWSYNGNGSLRGENSCGLSYAKEGIEKVTVTVTDNKGATGVAEHYINVIPPQPSAVFTVDGTDKENRKLNLKPIHPYKNRNGVIEKYPMVEEKWTITALDTANQTAIKTVQNLNGNLSYQQIVDLLIKKAGDYKIKRYVKNSIGLEDTVEMTITIQPDLPPVADFNTVTTIYRDDVKKSEGETSKAIIKATDNSYSRDDSIAKRIWTITFDENNNGDFSDDSTKVISNVNENEVQYVTDKVGKYLIELQVFEEFEQPTIEQFVDLSFDAAKTDRKIHSTTMPNPDKLNKSKPMEEKIVEVDNLAPTVSYELQKRETVNLDLVLTDASNVSNVTELETKAQQLIRTKLNDQNIDVDINVVKGFLGNVDNSTAPPLWNGVGEIPKGFKYWQRYTASGDYYAPIPGIDFTLYEYWVAASQSTQNLMWLANYTDPSNPKGYSNKEIWGSGYLPDKTFEVIGGGLPATFNMYYKPKGQMPYKMTENDNKTFVGVFKDSDFTNEEKDSIFPAVQSTNAHLMVGGSSKNKGSVNAFLKEYNNGVFIENTDISTTLNKMADYILSQLGRKKVDLQIDLKDSPFSEEMIESVIPEFKQRLAVEKLNANVELFESVSDYQSLISTGGSHTVIVKEDGTTWVTGEYAYGEYGDGNLKYSPNPIKINTNGRKVIAAKAINQATMLLYDDNTLWVTGTAGNIKFGRDIPWLTTSLVESKWPGKVVKIDADYNISAVILEDGTVWGRGYNNYGELGKTENYTFQDPVQINLPGKAKDIVRTQNRLVFLLEDGTVWSTGQNSRGAFGNGSNSKINNDPVKMNLPGRAIQIAGGKDHTAVLLEDGTVWSSGWNNYNQLGTGTILDGTYSPVKMKLSGRAKMVAAGGIHTVVLMEDGSVWTSGSNADGRYGNGTSQNTSISPMQMSISKPAIAITAGESNTVVVVENGEIYSTGSNYKGQYGNGSSYGQLRPVDSVYPVKMNLNWFSDTATGGFHKTNNPLFTMAITDGMVDGERLYQKISELNSNFIGVGNSTNENELNSIIAKNSNHGIYFEHEAAQGDISSVSREKARTVLSKVAEYIIEQLQLDKVDIQVALEGTNYTQTQIQSKLNEKLIPELNSEGIQANISYTSNSSTKLKDLPPGSRISFGNYNWVVLEPQQGYLYFEDVVEKRPPTMPYYNQQVLSSKPNIYLFNPNDPLSMGYYLNKDWLNTLSDEEQALIKVHDWKVTDKANSVKKTVSAKVGTFNYQEAKKYLVDNSSIYKIDRSYNYWTLSSEAIDNGGYSLAHYIATAWSPPYREASSTSNLGVRPAIYLDPNVSINNGKVDLPKSEFERSNNLLFGVVFSNNNIDVNHNAAQMLLNDGHFIGVGNESNETQIQDTIEKNMQRGTFIQDTPLDSAVAEMTEYIKQVVERKRGTKELYITLEEQIKYFTTFSDYEKDPKLVDRWKYDHLPTVFENDMGQDSRQMRELGTPIEQFTKVGRYQPYYSAKDDPLSGLFPLEKINLFESYRKWAKDADNWFIYVHRKPVPEFSFTINSTTGDYTIKNEAFDLDKESINIGFGPGLKSQKWSWRVQGETVWKEGLPSSPLQRKVYEVKNTVVDLQKREESKVKLMDATGVNKPPIAEFEPTPAIVEPLQDTMLVNTSYDPNGDDMTAKWYFKVEEQADTQYSEFAKGGAKTGGVANVNWSPLTNFLNEGTYVIKLVVTDKFGATDSTTRIVTVLPNNSAPKACMKFENQMGVQTSTFFIGDTIHVKSCSTDPENDTLRHEYTIVKPKLSGGTETVSIKTGDTLKTATGDVKISIDSDNHLTIQPLTPEGAANLPAWIGKWQFTLQVHDGKVYADNPAVGSITMNDQTVTGAVDHTVKWKTNLASYNAKYPSNAFNLNPSAGLVEFLPGEKFILSATESEYATDINVHIKEHRTRFGFVNLLETAPNFWTNSMWHKDMIGTFTDGEILSFEFSATFVNGWIDTDTVQVKIKDDPYWRQHTTK